MKIAINNLQLAFFLYFPLWNLLISFLPGIFFVFSSGIEEITTLLLAWLYGIMKQGVRYWIIERNTWEKNKSFRYNSLPIVQAFMLA